MKKKTQLEIDIEFIKTELEKISKQSAPYQLPQLPQISTFGTGEWCPACGAWRWYGQPDSHHCTGYKVTC